MKRPFLLMLTLSLVAFCGYAFGYQPRDSMAVSLLDEGSFVLRGRMSPRWGGMVRFAVSDPVKNRGMSFGPTARGVST